MTADDSEDSNRHQESPETEPTTQTDLSTDPTSVEPTPDESESSSTPSTESSSQSIEEMLLEFDEQEGLIRDRSLLDPNYVVDENRIVGRDEQLQEVTKMLRVALGDNRPPNLFLYGPSGSGK